MPSWQLQSAPWPPNMVSCRARSHLRELVGGASCDLGHSESSQLLLEVLKLQMARASQPLLMFKAVWQLDECPTHLALQIRFVLRPQLMGLDFGCGRHTGGSQKWLNAGGGARKS